MRETYAVQLVRVVASSRAKIRRKPAIERLADRLKAERVEWRLRSAPLWRLSRDAGFLRRTRRFPTEAEALLFRDFVQQLSVIRGVPVDVDVKGVRVEVVLHGEKTHRGWSPLNNKQLDFAVALS